MSKLACARPDADFQKLGYPPVKPTVMDIAKEQKATAIMVAAPFGKGPRGQIINRAQYQTAMQAEQRKARALDFRWPFWVGLGAGAVGLVVLIARRH